MLVLHGFYDHGKIEITDEKLPDMKANVEIIIKEKHDRFDFKSIGRVRIDTEKEHFSREEANAR